MKPRPPKRIDFALIKIKNGGYLLKWTVGLFQAVFGSPNRQAFTTYAEAMNAIIVITKSLT